MVIQGSGISGLISVYCKRRKGADAEGEKVLVILYRGLKVIRSFRTRIKQKIEYT